MVTLVLGAGPAGLAAAERLHGEVTVFEREHEIGGLCRSFEVGGCTFDYGGHAFFSSDDEVREFVVSSCAPGVHEQPRNAWVSSHGTLVPYPFIVVLVAGLVDGTLEQVVVVRGPDPTGWQLYQPKMGMSWRE